MTPFLPAGLGGRATASLALSALPDAPTLAVSHGTLARRGWRRMISRVARRVRRTGPQRTEPVKVDPYSAWRDAATLSADALRRWSRAAPSSRAVAHAVYRAALDDEDAAAVALARWRRGGRDTAAAQVARAGGHAAPSTNEL